MKRSRFDYVAYDHAAQSQSAAIKGQCISLEGCVDGILPDGRWKDLFMDHLEIAFMACGKGVRDEQIKRDESTQLQ